MKQICVSCTGSKVSLNCSFCKGFVCKDCAIFVSSETFLLREIPPQKIQYGQYCFRCHSAEVQPALREYRKVAALAKNVFIIDKPQRRSLPVIKKSEKAIHVVDCCDREEAVLRLAFLAAESGYNAVLRANVSYKKVRNEGYQKMMWSGTGFPAELDVAKLAHF